MKKILFYTIPALALLAGTFSCDTDYESTVCKKEVTLMIGVDPATPYASTLNVVNDAYIVTNSIVLASEPWEVIEGNTDQETPWFGFYTDDTGGERLMGGEGTTWFTLIVQRNRDITTRSATIRIRSLNSGVVKSLTVNQKDEPIQILLSEEKKDYLAEAVTDARVPATCNVPATIKVEYTGTQTDWITVLTSSGIVGDFDLNYNVLENTSNYKREAKIILYNDEYLVSDTLYVSQLYPTIQMTLTTNFAEPSRYQNPGSLDNVVRWSNTGTWADFTSIDVIVTTVSGTQVTKTTYETPAECPDSIDLTLWTVGKSDYANIPTDVIVKVNLYDAGGIRGMGELQANPHFASGDGTAANPFIINNYGQLNRVRNFLDKCYKMNADVDIALAVETPVAYTTGFYLGAANLVPIGQNSSGANDKPFTGVFDGNYKTISNLSQSNASGAAASYGIGLFGAIKGKSATERAVVKNLTVTGSITRYDTKFVGGIVGKAQNFCDVTGCRNKVNINVSIATSASIGGVVGMAGTATNSNGVPDNTSIITSGNTPARPPVVSLVDAVIDFCINEGLINCTTIQCGVGGIAGASFGPITRSVNAGAITCLSGSNTTNTRIGGIVGNYAGNLIDQCCNLANIAAWGSMGGIIGFSQTVSAAAGSTNICNVTNCYNKAAIASASTVATGAVQISAGGIIGNAMNYYTPAIPDGYAVCTNCYSLGAITRATTTGPFTTSCLIAGSASGVPAGFTSKQVYSSYGKEGDADQFSYNATFTSPPSGFLTDFTVEGNFSGWNFTTTWVMGASSPELRNVPQKSLP